MIKSRSAVSRLLTAATVLLCVATSANAQDKVLLRMNLHPGQTFDQGYVMEMESSSDIPKMSMDIASTSHFGFHKEVLDVDKDGNMKLKVTFQKSTTDIHGEIAGQPFPPSKNDSKGSSKKAAAMPDLSALLTGQSVVETMTPQGKVIKLEGMDAIFQRLLPGNKDAQVRAMTQTMMKKAMESSTKSSPGIVHFPEAAVAVGDSWTSEMTVPIVGQISTKYTLMSSKDGVATLAERATFSPNPKAPFTVDIPKLKMKTDMSGTMSGVVRVDEKTGLTISSELHTQMKAVASITVPKSTSKSKQKPEMPSSITTYMKGVMRSWTVKLPQ